MIRTRSECKHLTSHEGRVTDVTFADDSVLIAEGKQSTCVFEDFAGVSAAAGLDMSLNDALTGKDGKTKLMRITHGTTDWRPRDGEDKITASKTPLPLVEEFLHLGSIHSTSRDLGVSADISRRLKKAFSAQAALNGMWRDKHISRISKGQLVTTITLPTALYGSCNWALTRPNINRLERFWNRITRWTTYGVHMRDLQREGSKGHRQLRQEMGVGEIMKYVRRRLLVQTGHLIRKPIEDPAKQLLLGHVAGREITRRTRSGRRTGRQTQPPKTLQRYIRQTLDE